MTFPVEPFQDIVIAEQITEDVTPAGLILPGDDSKTRWANVVAVGPGRTYATAMNATGSIEAGVFVPTTVKVGDMVCFDLHQSGGRPLKLKDGREYMLFREGDLIGRERGGG